MPAGGSGEGAAAWFRGGRSVTPSLMYTWDPNSPAVGKFHSLGALAGAAVTGAAIVLLCWNIFSSLSRRLPHFPFQKDGLGVPARSESRRFSGGERGRLESTTAPRPPHPVANDDVLTRVQKFPREELSTTCSRC